MNSIKFGEAVSKNKQICHIEFIEMRTNLFTSHCHISALLNMTMIGVFETAFFVLLLIV